MIELSVDISLENPNEEPYMCETCGYSYDNLHINIDEEEILCYSSVGCYGGDGPEEQTIPEIVKWLRGYEEDYPWVKSEIREVIQQLVVEA